MKRKNRQIISLIIFIIIALFGQEGRASLSKAEKHFYSKNPEKAKLTAYELIRSRYFFSAIPFIAQYIVEKDQFDATFEKHLELIVRKTGIETLAGLPEESLAKHRSPSLSFILGLKLFKEKKFTKVIEYLDTIPQGHRFEPEALLTLGSAYSLSGDNQRALNTYRFCTETADNWQGKGKKENRYYIIIKEKCFIHMARLYYKAKKYELAIKSYEEISKRSYSWPYLLLEKAWSKYHLKDYNRSLGLLVTYKSPLLKSYFVPEGEVLTALSYFKLCLWQDSLKVIEQYSQVYKERSQSLRQLIIKHKKSPTYFLKLMHLPLSEAEKLNPYVRNLMTQVRKKVKFNLDLAAYRKVKNELTYLKKAKKSDFIQKLQSEVKESLHIKGKNLNHYIKKEMFHFMRQIHRYSYEMFNIKLEILSEQKDLIYQNKVLISERSRGDFSQVNRASNQHFWSFKGAFWADELGDYSFGLQSNCQVVKKGVTL